MEKKTYLPLIKQWDVSESDTNANLFDYVGKGVIPENMRVFIAGRLHGKVGVTNGTRIKTSYIVKIEVVDGHYTENGFRNELFRVTTESGSQYYIWSDKSDGNTVGNVIFVTNITSIVPLPGGLPHCMPGGFRVLTAVDEMFIIWPDSNSKTT